MNGRVLTAPPYLFDPKWVRLSHYARLMNQSVWTIRQYIADGTFEQFGVRTYKDPCSGYWYVYLGDWPRPGSATNPQVSPP